MSTDGGRTFHPIATGGGWDYHAIWWSADGRRIINGSDEGVILSSDGGKNFWQPYDLPFAQPYHVGLGSARTMNYRVCVGLQDDNSWCGPSSPPNGIGVMNRDWYQIGPGRRHVGRSSIRKTRATFGRRRRTRTRAKSISGTIGRRKRTTSHRMPSRTASCPHATCATDSTGTRRSRSPTTATRSLAETSSSRARTAEAPGASSAPTSRATTRASRDRRADRSRTISPARSSTTRSCRSRRRSSIARIIWAATDDGLVQTHPRWRSALAERLAA